jgi:hypothetical protein
VSLTHTKPLVENDQNFLFVDKVKIKKINKTHPHVLLGEFTLFKDLSDDYELLCMTFKKAGNAYKLLPFKLGPKKFCEFLQSETLLYPEFQITTDLPPVSVCPWPAKTYHLHGYHPDLSKLPPFLDTGDYMLECRILQDEKILNGIQVFASVLKLSPMAPGR